MRRRGAPCRHAPRSRSHPYTRHGRQVDVCQDDRWVEVWECGLAHPRVLAAAGLPGRGGLALGIGLDRLLMRVVLRDLGKTLTDETANALRDRIYRALHQGTEYQWAG